MKTSIPFSGFYESIHSQELDNTINQMFSDDSGNAYESLSMLANDAVNWQGVFIAYSQAYVKSFALAFQLKTLKFQELSSPREYNFTTDRIFCTLDVEEVKEIFSKVGKEKLDEKIHERFTSRSGFISFYRNSLEDWPEDVADWDANQVGTLIEVYIQSKHAEENSGEFDMWAEFDLMGDSTSEVLEPIIWENMDNSKASRVDKIYQYLRKREERNWKAKGYL